MRKKLYIELFAEAYNSLLHILTITKKEDYQTILLTFVEHCKKTSFTTDKRLMCMFILDYYINNTAKIYRFSHDFYLDLLKVNIDIDVSYLQHNKLESMFFELPIPLTHNGLFYSCAIVAFTRTSTNKKSLTIGFHSVNDKNIPDDNKYITLLCESGTVEEAVRSVPDYDETKIPLGWIETIAKCLLYIKSGEPDIQKENHVFNTKKLKNFMKKLKKVSPFSVVNVGYNYKKQIHYVDSTQVRTHMRWQPYGPHRAMVRLIWIKEHVRTYKKKDSKLYE